MNIHEFAEFLRRSGLTVEGDPARGFTVEGVTVYGIVCPPGQHPGPREGEGAWRAFFDHEDCYEKASKCPVRIEAVEVDAPDFIDRFVECLWLLGSTHGYRVSNGFAYLGPGKNPFWPCPNEPLLRVTVLGG